MDGFGYYLVGGTENAHHVYHPKVMIVEYAVPTTLFGGVEKDILVSVGCPKANDGVSRSIHLSRCGLMIPRSPVRYINGFQSRASEYDRNRVLSFYWTTGIPDSRPFRTTILLLNKNPCKSKGGIAITPFTFSIFIGEISKLLYKNPFVVAERDRQEVVVVCRVCQLDGTDGTPVVGNPLHSCGRV